MRLLIPIGLVVPVVSILVAAEEGRNAAVLQKFADGVDARYWANQTSGRFREFVDDLRPDLAAVVKDALASRAPGAGSLAEAGDALKRLGQGIGIWQAASANMLLVHADELAASAKHLRLSACLRSLASDVSGPQRANVSACLASAQFYRGLLTSPAAARLRPADLESWQDTLQWHRGTADFLGQLCLAIERTLRALYRDLGESGEVGQPQGPDPRWRSSDVGELLGLFKELEEMASIQLMMLDRYCWRQKNRKPDPAICARLPNTQEAVTLLGQHVHWLESIPTEARRDNLDAAARSEEVRRRFRVLLGRRENE